MGQIGHGIPNGFFFSVMTNKCTKTHVELVENHESYITHIYIYIYVGVSKNRAGPPKSSHFNRVFHDVHHPFFWVFPLFLETPIYM